MRSIVRAATTLFIAIAAVGLAAGGASAQPTGAGVTDGWTVEAGGGIEIPLGIMSEVQDLGPLAEAAAGYRVHPRVKLRAEGSLSFLQGSPAPSAGRPMPNMTVYRALGGADVRLWSPSSRLDVVASVGAGAATYDTEAYPEPVENPATEEVEADFNQTWFTASGRLKVTYAPAARTRIFVAAGGRATLADADATAVFGVFDPAAGTRGTDAVWALPFGAGVQYRF